jgi:protein-S-isoprenylcysteine O-methyltransferase Ste14
MVVRLAIWAAFLLGGTALGLWLDGRWSWARTLLHNPWWHLATLVLGALLLVAVLRASRYTGRLLARMGRQGHDVQRMDTNVLVTTDVYSCMRHPMHLGLMFFPLAIAFLIGSPTFIFIIAPLEMLIIVALIKLVEEPEAVAKFGDEYRRYMATTPMFSLRPDCIRKMLGKPLPRSTNTVGADESSGDRA